MPIHQSTFLNQLASKLAGEAKKRLPPREADSISPFLQQYYQQAAMDEFRNTSIADLYGAALSHWQHGRVRTPGNALINVYNPDYEKHGWQSTHTIIEIVVDNMPFLVDSVSMVLNRNNVTIHHTLHPVIVNRRNKTGHIVATLDQKKAGDDSITESFMQFYIDRLTGENQLSEITSDISETIEDVQLACNSWKPMHGSVAGLVKIIKENKIASATDRDEAADMVAWIANNHFTLLGYCELSVPGAGGLKLDRDSVLGILKQDELNDEATINTALPCSPERFIATAGFLTITKTNNRSTVHRPAYLDFIGVFSPATKSGPGRIYCIVGLFTSAAYNRTTREIPYLSAKSKRMMEASNLPDQGHLQKALQNVIETYPRDSLFQVSEQELEPIIGGILHLQERQHIRVFVATEPFFRFHSCLIYVPRDRFHSDLRIRIQNLLLQAFGGSHIEFNVWFSESVLARIHFLVYTNPDKLKKPNLETLSRQIEDAALSWTDHLRDTLVEQFGEEQGIRFFNEFGDAFPGSYQDDFSPRRASYDIQRIQEVRETEHLGIYFYRPVDVMDSSVRLRLYSKGLEVSLSDVIPMIENMGLRVLGEKPYELTPRKGSNIWIHEFTLVDHQSRDIDVEDGRGRFERAFAEIWNGNLENDGFNRLVLGAGLEWRECVMLRAYARYLKQIRIRYGQDYIIDTLTRNPKMTARLVQYFHCRLSVLPDSDREEKAQAVRAKFQQGLDRILNLDEDRILSAYINLIESTLRTNFYQCDSNGNEKSYLSFKLDPPKLLRMPEPRPMFEIFVYSPRVEAVHLRGGPVARGGLRWSDRPEDFRTEVLGLVKAQMVKNAVIIPVGSKGGFVVKKMPQGDRDTQMQEVIRCYKTFISGMLDITDNISGDTVVYPRDVVRHDSDDPYLVVAADKGTATFSDIANGVAKDYGFWLGDAFASGGSDGYDHKKMGITARGAWESVKRHFRELGVDTQTQPFTVIGIGDMNGDVFGNGMLLSNQIKLVGAFNHMHIFLDPDPDPEASFKERKRLFELPRSSWSDYNKGSLSQGGGVWSRNQKSISLSEQARKTLGITVEKLTPTELINHMLKAPVDLVWNGGIGTYVKAGSESHEQVRDRANDSLRVDGAELRCKVFGEGGNLGMTQLGRIEYNFRGGLCYTDAIDNSAGVDTSDHEVNIKILLDRSVAAGDLTEKQRNQTLASMTDEVGRLVLQDNYGQTEAISLAASNSVGLFRQHIRFIRALEKDGILNRPLEFLPDEETISERMQNNEGLCRAELSVLFAYSKLTLCQTLIKSDVPEDQFLSSTLTQYFPEQLAEKFHGIMVEHPLRREIITTHIVNDMVNRTGPTFAFRLWELTGASYPHIARAYTVTTEIFDFRSAWDEIEQLDNKVRNDVQKSMLDDMIGLIERTASWLIRNRPENMNISETVDYFKNGVGELFTSYPRSMAASNRLLQKKRLKKLLSAGVPKALAHRMSCLIALSSAMDIIEVAQLSGRDVPRVAAIYYSLGDKLELHWLRDQIGELPIRNHWQAIAAFSLRNELHSQQTELTALLLNTEKKARPRTMLGNWLNRNELVCERFLQLIADFKVSREIDFAMLSVAISKVKSMQSSVS